MIIKVCGITSREDAAAAVEAGATALGFNFWPRSLRYLAPGPAVEILETVPAGVLKVGLFVDAPAGLIETMMRELQLDVAQVHGPTDRPIAVRQWRALAATTPGLRDILARLDAEAALLDTPAGAQRGGTGLTFDWSLAAGLPGRIILAGGLDPDNVAAAIRHVRPWGVDACSRLESQPGRKDPDKVRAFVAAARKAFQT
jgi:phosphoribosylanthranilate isomerase